MNLQRQLGAPWPDQDVTGLCEHTAEVFTGCAFFAVATEAEVALDHGRQALAQGARLVISQHDLPLAQSFRYPGLVAERGELAAQCYGRPAEQLTCIGVTGTNGKTSVAYYITGLSDLLGINCGYIGTLGWGRLNALHDPNMTTPNPTALQRQLAQLVEAGCERVAIEVSSHALAQGRAHAVPFCAGVFTNLTRDHLDYHGTMAAYAAAKMQLFTDFPIVVAVLYVADPLSEQIAARVQARVVRYSQASADTDNAADWCWRRMPDNTIQWQVPGATLCRDVPVIADFALDNVTAALAVMVELGATLDALSEVLGELPAVPGRMEIVARASGHGTVVVDYAHTPDALEKALQALRNACAGRLICVVGCGGDRDKGKRPQMARVASQLADITWLTSDNPRTEPPLSILKDMQAGVVEAGGQVHTHADRREAIRRALLDAEVQDVVLIAGKGHEDYQEVGRERLPFDDRAVARSLLAEI